MRNCLLILLSLFVMCCNLTSLGQTTCSTTVPPTFSRPNPCFNDYFTSITASGNMGTTSSISITPGCTTGGYTDLFATQGIDAPVGADVIINIGRYTTHYTAYLSVYIDWDNDGVFEQHESAGWPSASNRDVQLGPSEMSVSSYHISPPCGAPSGHFRMRVLLSEALLNLNAPCVSTYGQAYDFYFNSYCPNNRLLGDTALCRYDTATLYPSHGCGLWSSSNPDVAIVDSNGRVTAGSTAGFTVIAYSSYACAVSMDTVTVGPEPIMGSIELCVGRDITLTCATVGGTWSSANAHISFVASGTTCTVSGVSSGATAVIYSANGCLSWHEIGIGSTVSVAGADTICVDVPQQLTVAIPGGTWTSSNDAIASVGTSGIVTGHTDGTVTVTYETLGGGCEGYKTIRVIAPTISASYPVDVTQLCTPATATMHGTPTGGWWTSGTPSVATINGSLGFIDGISPGTATITYTIFGCMETHTMTVYEGPTIAGPDAVCMGTTITLTTTPTGGTWMSGDAAVGTISSSNIVTPIISNMGTTYYYYAPNGCWAPHGVYNGGTSITGPGKVCTGGSITLTGWPYGAWTSSNTVVATVDASGNVSGSSAGTTIITFTATSFSTCYSTKIVTVEATTISGADFVCSGLSIDLSANFDGGTWTSSNSSVASVTLLDGIVSGHNSGTVTIYYNGACSASKIVSVGLTPTLSLASGSTAAICKASSSPQITLQANISGGAWNNSVPVWLTMASSDSRHVHTSSSVQSYDDWVTYTMTYHTTYTCSTKYSVHLDSIYVPNIGEFRCKFDLDNPPITLNAGPYTIGGYTWTSSNTSVATINSSSGVVTALDHGTTIISCTDGYNCSASSLVNIIPPDIYLEQCCTCTGITSRPVGIHNYWDVEGLPLDGTFSVSDNTVLQIDPYIHTTYVFCLPFPWSTPPHYIPDAVKTTKIRAIGVGTAKVYYNYGGCRKSLTFTVTP